MRSPLRRLGRHHSTAAAYAALVLALGGTAYAANAVTSEDIVDETIQSQDIAPRAIGTDEIGTEAVTLDRLHGDAVTGTKVADGTLWGVDVRNGSLSGHDVADGSLTGWDVADNSLTGSDLDVEIKTVDATTREPLYLHPRLKSVTAECPAGYTAISGGGQIQPDSFEASLQFIETLQLVASGPVGEDGWSVTASTTHLPNKDSWSLKAYARCAAL